MAEEKSNNIPSSARVWESAVIAEDKDKVWEAVSSCTFAWASDVTKTEVKGDANAVGGTRVITYTDKTTQTVQVVGISNLKRSVSWIMIASEPAFVFSLYFPSLIVLKNEPIYIRKIASIMCFYVVIVVRVLSVAYTSATHTISVKAVTNPSGKGAESFVEWTTDYSNDAKIAVIEDSRHKKKEAFKQMSAYFANPKK